MKLEKVKSEFVDLFVYCNLCNQRNLISNCFADLHGIPFIYFCKLCAEKLGGENES